MSTTKLLNRRTNVPGQVPGITDIDLGEVAINTHQGKMYIKRDKFGVVDVVQVGEDAVENVFYVSKSGEFGNSGTSLGDSFKTLDSAVSLITTLKSFAFDEAKCTRDFNFIFDGLYNDIAFGTNYNAVTSGHSYQRANANKVITDQLVPTRVSFNQARGAIGSVDEVKASTGESGALYRNNKHWSEIIDILVNGKQSTEQAHDVLEFPAPLVLTTPDADDAAIILQNNREWLKDELVVYISQNYPALSYDRVKCERDTGYIIDAIITDLMTGSNYNSVTAGLAYKRYLALPDYQSASTIDIWTFLRDRMLELSITEASKSKIIASVAEIADIMVNDVQAADIIITPDTPATTTNRRNAASQIKNNKQLLIDKTVLYLAQTYPTIQNYDSTKCARDVGYIVDAITLDLMLGTNYNTVTSGLAYVRVNAIPAGQVEFTKGAWIILRDAINALSISTDSQDKVTASIAEINDIIDNGATSADTLIMPDSINTSVTRRNAADQLKNNNTFIIDEVIRNISENSPALTIDRAKCSRDVGLIVEAISRDLLFGTNYNSITAGLAYTRNNAIPADTVEGTVAVITAIGTITDGLAIDASTKTALKTSVKTVTDIITSGISINDIVFPTTINSSVNEERAHSQIQLNKTLLIDNYIAYITANYPSLVYDTARCRRDVGFILDGLSHDILYDGNTASRNVAFSYFVDGVSVLPAGQVTAILAAYVNLNADLALVLAETLPNQDVTGSSQSGLLQVTTRLETLLNITINAITAGNIASVPLVENVDTTAIAEPMVKDYAAVVSSLAFIQTSAIAVYDLVGPVHYNRTKCRRDLAFILEALQHDILYGGNFGSFNIARSYFVDGVSQLGSSDEITASISAYLFLKTVVSSVVQETYTGQDTSGGLAGATEAATLDTLIDIIIDVVNAGNIDSIATRVLPDLTGITATDYNTINNAIVALKAEVIEYADWYGPVTYDRVKCKRDLGFILDGLIHDLTYFGNVGSVTNARSYFVGAVAQLGSVDEVTFTSNALTYLDLAIGQVILKTFAGQDTVADAGTAAEGVVVNDLISIIEAPILAGTISGLRATVLPDFTGIVSSTTVDYGLILAQKATITSQALTHVDLNGSTTYDKVRCRRDTGFIVDALTHDVLYGGTHGTTINARAYYVGAVAQLPADQQAATQATYEHLKTIVGQLITNTLTSNLSTGADLTGNASQYATVSEKTTLDSLLTIIVDVIAAGNLDALPAVVQPNLISRGVSVSLRNAVTATKAIQDFLILQSVKSAKNTGDTTIFLKSGDYTINNPVKLPPKTAIVGDNLRTTTVRPKSVDSDLFYVDNGTFIKDLTFRDHQNLAACVAFDPSVDSSRAGPFIVQSPYVQNCTSITNDGVGMRIDGSKCSGLKSMVSDAFTQYNAAGIGVHLLNRGFAQLVSIFTISTETSILAETGGQCSITNSNASFGDFGLVARGTSGILYDGQLDSDYPIFTTSLRLRNVINRDSDDYITAFGASKLPNYGDTMKFDSEEYYYTVVGVDSVDVDKYDITFEPPLNSLKAKDQNMTFRQRSLIASSSHTFEYVGSGTNTFTAIPQNGGIPKPEREVVFDSATNAGLVVFTSTDQMGDFRIGAELTIKRQEGRIVGETFERSLYAILTPYILALEGN